MRHTTRCTLVVYTIAAIGACTSGETAVDLDNLRAFAADYTAALSSQDPQRVTAFFADSLALRLDEGEVTIGREEVAVWAADLMATLPDMVVEMDSLLVKAGVIELHVTLIGTNSGPGGTGNVVRVNGFEEWALDADGLIAAYQPHFPDAEYARQLEQGGNEPDGWPLGVPADGGLDPAALDQLAADIEAGQFPNTHAVLIEHDGVLVYERYFSGSDQRWGRPIPGRVMSRNSLHDLRSISKSVTSALLGIALETDFEKAVSRPVVEYFPEFEPDEAQRSVTLHHALTMTAGLRWNEMTVPRTTRQNDEGRMYGARDPALYVLSRPIDEEPGSSWNYNGGLTQVVAAVISNITGQRIDEYARIRLFEPLGITVYEWLGSHPENPSAASGLRLRARDLAKIGSLYLHGGRWQGQQVIPQEWVERSVTRHIEENGAWSRGGRWGYGYQWWVGSARSGERVVKGDGYGDQRLFILPDERLVVTIFAGRYETRAYSERILERVLAAR